MGKEGSGSEGECLVTMNEALLHIFVILFSPHRPISSIFPSIAAFGLALVS